MKQLSALSNATRVLKSKNIPCRVDVYLSQQGIYFLFSPILHYDLLGTLRCAGIGKIPDWLIVLANNIDNLVVVLVSQAVGLNPDHIQWLWTLSAAC